jgi:hypothetical protein
MNAFSFWVPESPRVYNISWIASFEVFPGGSLSTVEWGWGKERMHARNIQLDLAAIRKQIRAAAQVDLDANRVQQETA